ncbi:mitochondrial matrix Mmp37 [Apiospora marii]|uniref:mitochondrial matrix Mmp37 n=1 Tax=Apiospora marii TaxID=335849 RepID=UPI003130B962
MSSLAAIPPRTHGAHHQLTARIQVLQGETGQRGREPRSRPTTGIPTLASSPSDRPPPPAGYASYTRANDSLDMSNSTLPWANYGNTTRHMNDRPMQNGVQNNMGGVNNHLAAIPPRNFDPDRDIQASFRHHAIYRVVSHDVHRSRRSHPEAEPDHESHERRIEVDRRSVFIGNLPSDVEGLDREVRLLAGEIGHVVNVQVIQKAGHTVARQRVIMAPAQSKMSGGLIARELELASLVLPGVGRSPQWLARTSSARETGSPGIMSSGSSSDWEEDGNFDIEKFTDLPYNNFGVNQHIVTEKESKECLRQVL